MCLNKITQAYPGRGIGPIIAFKKFKIVDGNIKNLFRTCDPTLWQIGKEESAGPKSNKIRNVFKNFSYPSGFHAYKFHHVGSWLGSKGVWAKVRLRGVQTRGIQGGRTVYVARYCKILEILGK